MVKKMVKKIVKKVLAYAILGSMFIQTQVSYTANAALKPSTAPTVFTSATQTTNFQGNVQKTLAHLRLTALS